MDSIEQIGKLKQLLDSGLIDEGEFHKLKKELLDSIEKADSKKIIVEKIDVSEQPKSKLKKSPKTLRNLILGVLAVGIITILVYVFYFNKEDSLVPSLVPALVLEEKNESTLVPYLKLNGKYVFVDSATMEDKFKKEYESCRLFSEDVAAVMINEKWGFVDKEGNQIIQIKYDKCGDFKEGLAKVKFQNKWGFVDKSGNEIIPFKYDEVGDFIESFARVEFYNSGSNNLSGFIDKSGKEVIPCKFTLTQAYFKDGIVAVGYSIEEIGNTKFTWGFFNNKGDGITPMDYDDIDYPQNGYAAVAKGNRLTYKILDNEKWGYIDYTGKLKIPLKYSSAKPFSEGLAAVGLNGKCGYIDTEGKEVIPAIYELAWPFSEGLAAVSKNVGGNEKVGFIDKTGKIIIDFKFKHSVDIFNFKEGFAAVAFSNNKLGFIDKVGNVITKNEYNHVAEFDGGVALVALGNELYGSDGYIGFEGKWGIVNTRGEEIVPIIYDGISNEKGFLNVTLKESSFYIDKSGREFREQVKKTQKNAKAQPATDPAFTEYPD